MNIDIIKSTLSEKRLCAEDIKNTEDNRSPFDMDHDRIIYSHFFRRMHDKTQVFPYSPLSNSSQARSRLSHSLEVSCVGRSLGNLYGKFLNELNIDINPYDVGTIIATACLAHDIGNPPFGHSGEDAISSWARQNLKNILPDKSEAGDLFNFEGNAQGFRILSRLENPIRSGGMRPTYALLTAYSKYTSNSVNFNKENKTASLRKSGYFKEDEKYFDLIYKESLLESKGSYYRSPLAFLSEAADDICYAIIDVEDAFHLGLLDFETAKNLIIPLTGKEEPQIKNSLMSKDVLISKIRSKAINNLISETISVFKDNFSDIIAGKFNGTLISKITSKEKYSHVVDFSRENIYTTDRVIEIECAGFKAIGGLLDIFINSLITETPGKEDLLNRMLVPKIYFYRHEINNNFKNIEAIIEPLTTYQKIISVTDYISSMTDRYAIELYQRLSGIKLPVY